MKFINFFLATLFGSFVSTGFSQNLIFKETHVDQSYEKTTTGANRNLYSWATLTLFGTDLAVGDIDSKQDFSNYYSFTWNHKFKMNRLFSYGLGYGVHRQVYRLREKGLAVLHREAFDKGKLVYWGVNANCFWRINFDPKRGNILGKYLDLAVFGQFNFYQKAKFIDGDWSERRVGKDFTERFVSGVEARIGHEVVALFVRYKLFSEHSKDALPPFTNLDLARWSIGLNLNIGS